VSADKFSRGSVRSRTLRGMGLPLDVGDWPPAPIRTERLLLRPPEAGAAILARASERFEECGAEQWSGIRRPG